MADWMSMNVTSHCSWSPWVVRKTHHKAFQVLTFKKWNVFSCRYNIVWSRRELHSRVRVRVLVVRVMEETEVQLICIGNSFVVDATFCFFHLPPNSHFSWCKSFSFCSPNGGDSLDTTSSFFEYDNKFSCWSFDVIKLATKTFYGFHWYLKFSSSTAQLSFYSHSQFLLREMFQTSIISHVLSMMVSCCRMLTREDVKSDMTESGEHSPAAQILALGRKWETWNFNHQH